MSTFHNATAVINNVHQLFGRTSCDCVTNSLSYALWSWRCCHTHVLSVNAIRLQGCSGRGTDCGAYTGTIRRGCYVIPQYRRPIQHGFDPARTEEYQHNHARPFHETVPRRFTQQPPNITSLIQRLVSNNRMVRDPSCTAPRSKSAQGKVAARMDHAAAFTTQCDVIDDELCKLVCVARGYSEHSEPCFLQRSCGFPGPNPYNDSFPVPKCRPAVTHPPTA